MNETIVVSGTGSVAADPDLAEVTVGVEVVGRNVGSARQDAAAGITAIIGSLRASGLEDADIATAAYSISPEYDHREGRRLRGYRVSNTVVARVSNLESFGEIVDAAAAAGSDHAVFNGIRFLCSDDRRHATAARAAAFADAKAKAAELAELANVGLGPVVSVVEQDQSGLGPSPVRAMKMEAATATPLEPGQLDISVSLQVQFSIGPKWA